MAQLIRLGAVGDPGELAALNYLERALPAHYLVLANAQVPDKGALVEVDALALGAPGIFVLEIKHWIGKIVGTEAGTWTVNGTEVKNPIHQVKHASQIVKGFITNKGNAKRIFVPDPRVAASIRVWAIVAFWGESLDTSGIKLSTVLPMWFLGCLPMVDLVQKIQAQHDKTMHRLKPEEICRLSELLGASRRELDVWLAEQVSTGQPYVPSPAPLSLKCPQCGAENRSEARFCRLCGRGL